MTFIQFTMVKYDSLWLIKAVISCIVELTINLDSDTDTDLELYILYLVLKTISSALCKKLLHVISCFVL